MFSKHFPPSLPLCILYFVFHKGKDTFAISPPSIHHLARRKGILKGNPNFQGILNWIIQILHYYCRKQHKNIENSWIIEQNVAISLSLLSTLLIATCTSFAFLNGRVFLVLGHSLEHHNWSLVVYIVSFSALKIVFSKLSLAKYLCLHKKPYIFHAFNHQPQNVFKNLSFINSSVQIFVKLY